MSRFMQSMRMKERSIRKRAANESLTDREIKFYRPKLSEVVSADYPWNHIRRMREEAATERVRPTEWWRRLARVLQVLNAPFNQIEYDLIKRVARNGYTIAEVEEAILRYRRLTNTTTKESKPPSKKQAGQMRRLRGRIKPKVGQVFHFATD